VGPATLSGFGTLRLIGEPFRVPSPLGEPLIPPTVLAIGWIAVGAGMALAFLWRPRPGFGR
jgi:hypothetical protein